MRKVVLTASDFEMFDTDISSVEYEFFQKHKEAFKRMWIEQGKKFWIQFVMTFRQFAVDYGSIKEFPAKNDQFEDFVDQAFIIIHENFCDGKFGTARNLIMDIVMVAQNRHTLQYLESKSYAKDPFYNKDTRDVFRRLFGSPTEKASYVKVYILLPIYLKYGGAVCICLRRWLDANDCPDDEYSHTNDKPINETNNSNSNSISNGGNIQNGTIDTDKHSPQSSLNESSLQENESSSSSSSSDSKKESFDSKHESLSTTKKEQPSVCKKAEAKKKKNKRRSPSPDVLATCTDVISIENGVMRQEKRDPDKNPDNAAWIKSLSGPGANPHKQVIHFIGAEGSGKTSLMNALLGKQNPLTGKASGPTITEIIDTSDSVGKGSKKDEKNKNAPQETNAARNASQSKKPQQQSAAKIDQNNGKCKKTASTETFSNKKNQEIQTETSADEIEAMIKKEDKSVGDYINPIFQQNDDCFRLYIEEVTKGSSSGPCFVENWPLKKDPRFCDAGNPLYDPKSDKPEWKTNLKLGDFEDFVYYVSKHYKNGKKLQKHLVKYDLEEERQRALIKKAREKTLNRSRERDRPSDFEEMKRREEQEKVAQEEAETRKKQDEERKRQKKIRKKLKKGLPVDREWLDSCGTTTPPPPPPVMEPPIMQVTTTKDGMATISMTAKLPEMPKNSQGVPIDSVCNQCNGCIHRELKGPDSYCPVHKTKHKQSPCGSASKPCPNAGKGGAGHKHNHGNGNNKTTCKIRIEHKSSKGNGNSSDPRKPYNMDSKSKDTTQSGQKETKLLDKRKEEKLIPEQTEANSVKLTKKVDEKNGTVSLTIEKRDQKGKLTTETTVKPISEDANIWEEAMKKISPVAPPSDDPPVLNEKAQEELIKKLSQNNFFSEDVGADGDNLSKTGKNWGQGEEMKEEDKKQFREMYQEISSSIADVARHNQVGEEDGGKCAHFMCNHDSRHEKARNRLRRKLGERKQDRRNPNLPGLLRLGGTVEYPADEREAMMLTLSEMTKMSTRERELFQERLGRTKYFKDCQEDPRDVADSMGACLFPGMKEEMMSQKSKQKIERVREMEAEAVKERKFGIPDAIRDIEVAKKSTTLQDSGLSENDLEKIVGYKDDVKRMKEELQYNNLKLNNMLEKQKQNKKDYVKTGREFEEQVKKASDDLKILEQKIAFLDRECAGLDNPEFNASVLKASQELKLVKRKVEKWEMDADILNAKIDKFEQGMEDELLDEKEIDEADKDTHSDKDELDYELSKRKGPIDQEKAFEAFKTVMGLDNFPFESDIKKEERNNMKEQKDPDVKPKTNKLQQQILEKEKTQNNPKESKMVNSTSKSETSTSKSKPMTSNSKSEGGISKSESDNNKGKKRVSNDELQASEIGDSNYVVVLTKEGEDQSDGSFKFTTLELKRGQNCHFPGCTDCLPDHLKPVQEKKNNAGKDDKKENKHKKTTLKEETNHSKSNCDFPGCSSCVKDDSKKDTSESSNSSLPDVSAINSYWNAAKSHDPEVKPKGASKGKKKSKEPAKEQPSTKPKKKQGKGAVNLMSEKEAMEIYMKAKGDTDGGEEIIAAMAGRSKDKKAKKHRINTKGGGFIIGRGNGEEPFEETLKKHFETYIRAQKEVDDERKAEELKKLEPKIVDLEDMEEQVNEELKKYEKSPLGFKTRNCSNCSDEEPAPKAFKKCQRCKGEGIKAARYYCGRDCQVADWKAKHKQEHADGTLK